MSGDVQPRKRKDKKRGKRDAFDRRSEGELSFSRQSSFQDEDESSHGVHITKMGGEDVHLHVQHDHGTGGHWCAKIFFFSLLVVLLGLVALIITENRDLSNLDTPLSESRFSNYFDGWVEEHREEHDDHDPAHASIEEHEEHEVHSEPLEEEEDHSEVDDEDHEDEHDEENDEDQNEQDDEEEVDENGEDNDTIENEEENVTAENEEDNDEEDEDDENITKEATVEVTQEEAEDDDDEVTAENDEEDDNEQNEDDDEEEQSLENNDEDEKDDENKTVEDAEDDEEQTVEENNTQEDDDNNDVVENADDEEDEDVNISANTAEKVVDNDDDYSRQHQNNDDPFDEDDDEGTIEEQDDVVDNDAEEISLLKEKAKLQAAANAKNSPASVEDDQNDDAPEATSWGSSQIKPKDSNQKSSGGAQDIDDDDDDLFDQELRRANDEMMSEDYPAAIKSFKLLVQKYPDKPQAFLGIAQTLDVFSEIELSNDMLIEAIEYYKRYLAFEELVKEHTIYVAAAERCIDRMHFMGYHQQTLPIIQMLMERDKDNPRHRNELVVAYNILNRYKEAKDILIDTLGRWPDDGFAKALFGYILKHYEKKYYAAISFLKEGIDSAEKGTKDGRFYYHLGDALFRVGRGHDAIKIYERGVKEKLFPSIYQRSFYNEGKLRAKPIWTMRETSYELYFKKLENNWQAIRAEGAALLNKRGFFTDETENLRDYGEWKQFELYIQGQRIKKNCKKAPITCSLINDFPAAKSCTRGQVKFSVMHPKTHVWPHCGPTNCRLRAHLGLIVPHGPRIRVADVERTWKEGKFLIFDDSFEHEVWHDGESPRLVLIVDVWHPDLSSERRRLLEPI